MKRIYLVLLIVFLSLSCKSTTEPIADKPTDSILPMKVGNYWVMQSTYYDTLGNITSILQDTIHVIREQIVLGTRYSVVLDKQEEIYYVNRNDGLYALSGNGQEVLILKYPASPGDSYFIPSVYIAVISTDTLVSVPKGNLHCYHYFMWNTSGNCYPVDDYYSPGIGYVQIEVNYNYSSKVLVRRKLVDYFLK